MGHIIFFNFFEGKCFIGRQISFAVCFKEIIDDVVVGLVVLVETEDGQQFMKDEEMLFQGENDIDSFYDEAQTFDLSAQKTVHLDQKYPLVYFYVEESADLSFYEHQSYHLRQHIYKLILLIASV